MVSYNRGIPPWDNANTLYIEREEIKGMLALFSSCWSLKGNQLQKVEDLIKFNVTFCDSIVIQVNIILVGGRVEKRFVPLNHSVEKR